MNTPAPKKSLGQHWLNDEMALNAIAECAQLTAEDTVLEIGPGLGTLTKLLCQQAREVIAVEYDSLLASQLHHRLTAPNLRVVQQDILSFDFSALPPAYKVVANIPYYLTSNLIRVISETSNPPLCAVLLIQKEVAERVVAPPGAMSLLSVSAQYYWHTSLGRMVDASLFTPPPKVHSQILILTRRTEPLFPEITPQLFFRVVKVGFAQRRKTLLNSLSSGLHIDRALITQLCTAADVVPTRRPQTLSLSEWYTLYKTLAPHIT